MKILYVTPMWTGLYDILYEGVLEARGMPAFIKPLRTLIDQDNEIDMYIIRSKENIPTNMNIKCEWFKKVNIIGVDDWVSLNAFPINLLKLIKIERRIADDIKSKLKNNSYDFVYVHGGVPSAVTKVIEKSGLPYGHRLYGSFLYRDFHKKGKIKTMILNSHEISIFKSKKKFLLITNDGSKGDWVVRHFNGNNPPYKFKFWYNGVDKMPDMTENELDLFVSNMKIKKPFLFYLARIDEWKRQDKAIEIIRLLRLRGYDFNLYIAGQIHNEVYYKKLKSLVTQFDLEQNVFFMGVVDKTTINAMNKASIASFSLYDDCNLGNVFLEMLSSGAIIIGSNDGTLEDFIANGVNGFLVSSCEEAVDAIIKVFKDMELQKSIRRNALLTYSEKLRPWSKRVDYEVDLIKSTVQKNKY